ncbi:MAG: IPTL-CTERM sorting domain-containing protein [Bacteroidota bacterium]
MKKLVLLIWVMNWLSPSLIRAQCTNIIEQNSNSSTTTVDATREIGQTFVPCEAKFLDSLEVMISNLSMATVDLELKIAQGGTTTTGVLHTQTVRVTQAGTLTIPLSRTLTLSGGTLYTFSLVGTSGSSGDISYALGIGDRYQDGTALVNNTASLSADLQFKIFFSSLPVPDLIPTMSQWGLLIFGLLILNCSVWLIRRSKLATAKE